MYLLKNLSPETRNLKPQKGFTFIELLVVIAVIGILYAIVIGSINNSKAKGRDIKRIGDISVIQLALERYYDENSSYPTSLSAFSTDSSVPANDPQGNNYLYVAATDSGLVKSCVTSPTDCQYYHLGATLELYNSVLADDADKNSAPIGGFNGRDDIAGPFVYDVVPKF
ncbi:MAG: prepilin-type N-terminal cleavage/methylation domain-containing protein [Patescibacteria group bacterium]|nr:prepilin-type N-terminal cleavage/methylation domain-containing protein [Patescibacteria group bacterium]MDE2218247.1 prepilin-type N-terminal cleavage/methylation domain-containing protein [Patescibacteria group bacterium]